jgi:dethiobiotin synthetase
MFKKPFDQPFSCFVTGTDTEIGKTLISSAIVHLQAMQGYKVVGMKPVAAGTTQLPHSSKEWVNEDVQSLRRVSSVEVAKELTCPYLFNEPIAPHIAAANEGREIKSEVILKAYEQIQSHAQAVVVEGVGGFRVPLSSDFDTADLAVILQLPVVLVVGMRLGCINHALLSAEAIRARGLELMGWVANSAVPEMARFSENIDAINNRIDAPMLASIPFMSEPSAEIAAGFFRT